MKTLITYQRDEDGDYMHPVTQIWTSALEAEDETEMKRFTDAELAAEYWAAAEEATSHHFRATDRAIEAQRIEGKLYDFARRPHASESGYQ